MNVDKFFAFAERLKPLENIPLKDDLGARIDKLASEVFEYLDCPLFGADQFLEELRDVLITTALLANVRGVEDLHELPDQAMRVENGSIGLFVRDILDIRLDFRGKKLPQKAYLEGVDYYTKCLIKTLMSMNYDYSEFFDLAFEKMAGYKG
ncbi:MAG: hypothetical protein GY799_32590 [Desulfobulbaceae bacterium]|nr:hypothetical protein [Desulfobulbaceae bacterium]